MNDAVWTFLAMACCPPIQVDDLLTLLGEDSDTPLKVTGGVRERDDLTQL